MRQKNIPLRVKNTFQPDHDGTLITNDYESNALADDDISILAIQQGMRQVDIRVIVSNDNYKGALRALHRKFFESTETGAAHKVA